MGTARMNSRIDRGNSLIPAVFFLSPLATSVAPRLTPFFIAIVGFTLIGRALLRGMPWRKLLPRRLTLAACLLFAAFVLLSAAWSADPLAGVGKGALLTALILITFAAIEAATNLDDRISRHAAFAFAAGAGLGTLFIAFELLTDGLATRSLMQWLPLLERSPKHVKLSRIGEIRSLNLSKLDQKVNLAMFHLLARIACLDGPNEHTSNDCYGSFCGGCDGYRPVRA